MPKSSPSQDSTKSPIDEQTRANDIALRKKKNAEAQAAFRARRTNYIGTLEETVNSLESVLLQVQEANRDIHAEAMEWKQQYARLRLEFREREKYWKCLWQSRKSGHPIADDAPTLASSGSTAAALLQAPNTLDIHADHDQQQIQYPDQSISFRTDESCPPAYPGSDHPPYTTTSDAAFSPEERLPKYGQYTYPVNSASPRDPRWSMPQLAAGNPVSGPEGHHSPVYLESPSLTAPDMTYSSRPFGGAPEEQKVQLNTVMESGPYTFSNEERFGQRVAENSVPGSRSLSPSSSTPASASSTIAPAYPFTFPDPTTRSNDRGEIDMRRHSGSHGGEATFHGGTADLSSLSGLTASDSIRYRLSIRKSDAAPDSQQQGGAHSLGLGSSSATVLGCPLDNDGRGNSSSAMTHQDRASSESDSNGAAPTSRLRRRRGTRHTSSRSPSLGPPSLSCTVDTVAAIRAQAFGALRRTRARGKKSSEEAAKVAMDVLEARGIGIVGPMSSKRPRIDGEARAMET